MLYSLLPSWVAPKESVGYHADAVEQPTLPKQRRNDARDDGAVGQMQKTILCSLYVHRVLQRLESLCDSDPQIPEEMNSPTPGQLLCPQRS